MARSSYQQVLKELEYPEAVAQRCINVFFKISLNSQENTWARVSFLLQQETLVQVFSREISEICKNTYFTKSICEWLLLNTRKCFTKEFPIAFLP